jgi:hypothetical protein
MANEPEKVVYEVSVEGAEEAIRALKEVEANDVRFIIITIREVKPWHGLLQYM